MNTIINTVLTTLSGHIFPPLKNQLNEVAEWFRKNLKKFALFLSEKLWLKMDLRFFANLCSWFSGTNTKIISSSFQSQLSVPGHYIRYQAEKLRPILAYEIFEFFSWWPTIHSFLFHCQPYLFLLHLKLFHCLH